MSVRHVVAAVAVTTLVGIALPVSPSYAAGPTSVYVAVPSDGGSDANDCSQPSPCASVAAAMSAVADGGTIHVGPGPFSGDVVPGGKSVDIVGDSTAGTILTNTFDSNRVNSWSVVTLDSGTTTLSNLTVQGAVVTDVLVYGTGHLVADHVVLSDAGCPLQVAAGSASLTDSAVQDGGESGSLPGCNPTALGQPILAGDIVVTGGTVTLTRTQVRNPAETSAGIQLVTGDLNVDQSFFDDSAHDVSTNSSPGLVNTGGSAVVTRSTFHGWGLQGVNGANGTTTVSDSTFQGNLVGMNGGSGTATVVRSTFEDVMASLQGPVSVAGSVLGTWANRSPSDQFEKECTPNSGAAIDLGYNLSTDDSCGFTQPTSQEGVADLHLGSGLADWGGLIPTVATYWPSPAVDLIPVGATYGASSTPLCDVTDLRGVPRPQATGCDAGSMEQVATTTGLTAPTTAKPHASVTLDATVGVPDVGVSGIEALAGGVTFRSGSTVLCRDVVLVAGRARCVTTALGAGSRTVRATFTPVDGSTLHASVSPTRTIKVGTMPVFTSKSRATFVVGTAHSFRVRASGSPAPRITLLKGTLPAGLTFKAGTGTATVSGRARASAVGSHWVTVQATNLRGSVRQVLRIVVSRS